MRIAFTRNDQPTIGVELEVHIVDAGGTLPEVVMALADELESGLFGHR